MENELRHLLRKILIFFSSQQKLNIRFIQLLLQHDEMPMLILVLLEMDMPLLVGFDTI